MEPPSIVFPRVAVENVDQFLDEMISHDKLISAGVMVIGDAAEYAEVWEWGNVRQTKAGPKTVKGTNPDGKSVWLSIQAPFGYIRINEPFMHRIVDEVMAEVSFQASDPRAVTKQLEKAAKKISKAIAEVIADSAPFDSGLLRKSIVPVDPNDLLLDREIDEHETLDLSED